MSAPNLQSNSSTRRSSRWLPFASIALLVWLAWRFLGGQTFDLEAFGRAFGQMDPWWLALSILLVLITYAGRALRWLVMIRPVAPQARFWPLFEMTMIGFCAAVLMGRAGEFVRPYLIAKEENVSFSSQLAVWFLERLTDLMAVLVIFGWALSSIEPAVAANVGPQIRWVLQFGGRASIIVGIVSLLILLAFRQFPAIAQKRVADGAAVLPAGLRDRLAAALSSFATGLNSTRNSRSLFLIFLYSVGEWLLIAACYYCIFRSFEPTAELTVKDTLVVLGFVSFGSVVQVPGIGGGMQIVTILVLREMFGVPLEQAAAAATMLWGIGLAIVVPPGLILAARRGLNWRRLRVEESAV